MGEARLVDYTTAPIFSQLTAEQAASAYLAGGSTYPELTEAVAQAAGMPNGAIERKRFANTEVYVRLGDSVRKKHAVLLQTFVYRDSLPETDIDLAPYAGWSVNDSIVQLENMVAAARRSSADEITVIAPFFPYSREDRRARGRESLAVAERISHLADAGVRRIVSVDLHSPQSQSAHKGPFDPLTAEPLLLQAAYDIVVNYPGDVKIVAADTGQASPVEDFSENLTRLSERHGDDRAPFDFTVIPKKRDPGTGRPKHKVPADVKGHYCLVLEDMIDTFGTLDSLGDALMEGGAEGVAVVATHGLFSPPAIERMTKSIFDKFVITDTVPVTSAQEALGSRLTVYPIAPMIGQAVVEIVSGGSVSRLFNADGINYSQFN